MWSQPTKWLLGYTKPNPHLILKEAVLYSKTICFMFLYQQEVLFFSCFMTLQCEFRRIFVWMFQFITKLQEVLRWRSTAKHNPSPRIRIFLPSALNPLTPNEPYRGRTAPLTSKRYSLYIYSTNILTEYFKHGIYSPFFSLQNAVCFIILTYLVPVSFTFHIQDVLKLKKK